MDSYIIIVLLFQLLIWKIIGDVVRVVCVVNEGSEIIFDFDVKENVYEMQINVCNEFCWILLLQILLMNGWVILYKIFIE